MSEATRDSAGAAEAEAVASDLRVRYEISATLTSSLDLDELLRTALSSVESLLGIDRAAVYLAEDSETPALSVAARRGLDDVELPTLPHAPAADWHRRAVGQAELFVGDGEQRVTTPLDEAAERSGAAAFALVPITSRSRVRGLLLLLADAATSFRPERAELLLRVGADLGVAVDNVELFTLVQRGRDEWLLTFDAVEEQLALLNSELKVRRANRALLDAHGSPAEVIGRPCHELFPELCGDGCPHRQALDGERTEREVAVGDRLLRLVVYPAPGSGVIHVAHDITAEKKREEELLQTEKLNAVSTVLAGVAHELNNPLTVVIAYAELLSKTEEAAPYHDEIQLITRNGLRCQSIVRNLLAFTRTTAGADTSEVDVNKLVRETVPLISYQLRVSGVRLEERLQPSLPPVTGDRNRLQVVLVNVLNNAHHAVAESKHGGYIRIVTRAADDQVELRVEDDGNGIPPDVLPRVFEPLFSTRAGGTGSGLGLSLAQRIVHEHGGDIEVASDVGRGTTATIRLPVRTAARREPEPEPAIGCLSGRRVLVVDDEPDVRTLVSSALTMFGADVESAASGDEALATLATDARFDVVFTDLRMPGMGGDELTDELRERAPELAERVILTTGDVATPEAEAALERTGRPFLAKPFNVHELVRAILGVVEHRSASASDDERRR